MIYYNITYYYGPQGEHHEEDERQDLRAQEAAAELQRAEPHEQAEVRLRPGLLLQSRVSLPSPAA